MSSTSHPSRRAHRTWFGGTPQPFALTALVVVAAGALFPLMLGGREVPKHPSTPSALEHANALPGAYVRILERGWPQIVALEWAQSADCRLPIRRFAGRSSPAGSNARCRHALAREDAALGRLLRSLDVHQPRTRLAADVTRTFQRGVSAELNANTRRFDDLSHQRGAIVSADRLSTWGSVCIHEINDLLGAHKHLADFPSNDC